jgi:hypothetical protein
LGFHSKKEGKQNCFVLQQQDYGNKKRREGGKRTTGTKRKKKKEEEVCGSFCLLELVPVGC